jgi:hypothetical protein
MRLCEAPIISGPTSLGWCIFVLFTSLEDEYIDIVINFQV